jgi:hypothetical protein
MGCMYRSVTISQYRSDKVAIYKEAKNTRFIVELTKAGNIRKRWEFRYQLNKKDRVRTLRPTTLDQDRKILQEWRDLLAAGIDPLEVSSSRLPIVIGGQAVKLKADSFQVSALSIYFDVAKR